MMKSIKLGSGMRQWFLPAALLLALALSGCDSQKFMNALTPEKESKAGQAFIDDIRTGNFAPVLSAIDPQLAPQLNADLLGRMRALFGGQSVKSVKVVGSHVNTTPEFKRYSFVYEYELTKQWLIADIVLQPVKGHLQIEGFHAQQMSQSLEQFNAFTLQGRGAKFLIFLGLTVLFSVFVIATTIVCWRTPIPRRKWLWRIFVLVGITQFTLNWTTGDLGFQPLQINLLSAGFIQQLYGPIILQLGVPVGAIMFWIRRRKWLNQAEENARHFS
jgi:hypothetical protein